MTDDYTPNTKSIRKGYAARFSVLSSRKAAEEDFDVWLRKVKADAWAECYELWALGPAGDFPDREDNPYL